jgi:hypothetical protein
MSAAVVVSSVALALALVITACSSWAWRKHRLRLDNPRARYERDIQRLQLAKYQTTTQRYTPQIGGDGPGSDVT